MAFHFMVDVDFLEEQTVGDLNGFGCAAVEEGIFEVKESARLWAGSTLMMRVR